MQLINVEGSAIFGPGSEWFWSMLQFLIVAVTLVGIYYQLRIAKSANAFDQLNALVAEWQGEPMVRKRVAVLYAIRDGAAMADIPDFPAGYIADYWEKVASLARAGHISPDLIAEGLGAIGEWWGILAPFVEKVRSEDGNPLLWEHLEWLADTLVKMHPVAAFDPAAFERSLGQRITSGEWALRDLEAGRR